MKKKICQLVHTLSYGDAISSEVLTIKRSLEEQGVESEIYSINTHPKYKGKTKSYKDFDLNEDMDVILHYSLGSDLNTLYQKLQKQRKILIYHNITPKKYFDRVNPRVASDIENGIKDLAPLCKVSDIIISDSTFNKEDIVKLGCDSLVLPLPFDNKKWEIPENEGIKNLLRKDNAINILHTGRLAPNKCIEDVIKSFYYLNKKFEKKSYLYLVGIDVDTEIYSFSLKELVKQLDLKDNVTFCGSVADSELKAFYKNASCYLTLSEHEGFCVPVLEAMNFSLPVVAYNGTALTETVGDGGILFDKKDYLKIAGTLYEICTNRKLRNEIVRKGHERIQEFSYENFSKKLLEILK